MIGHMKTVLTNVVALIFLCLYSATIGQTATERIKYYVADPATSKVQMYWKDRDGQLYKNLENLRASLERDGQLLLFGMNGGMYRPDNSPQGLYIEKGVTHIAVDSSSGSGNFYLKPNGIFFLTEQGEAFVCETSAFKHRDNIAFATQSGPMLLSKWGCTPGLQAGVIES
jgi:uncharacterized protein YigE (DUF2233 family)